jgi:hypothetical protein
MSYYFSKTVKMPFDDAVTKVTEGLKKEGFGILTDIDVKETFKKKLSADFRKYRILGVCNTVRLSGASGRGQDRHHAALQRDRAGGRRRRRGDSGRRSRSVHGGH